MNRCIITYWNINKAKKNKMKKSLKEQNIAILLVVIENKLKMKIFSKTY